MIHTQNYSLLHAAL